MYVLEEILEKAMFVLSGIVTLKLKMRVYTVCSLCVPVDYGDFYVEEYIDRFCAL